MGDIARIDRGTNKVISRFRKGDLLQRAEVSKIPDLTLAGVQHKMLFLGGGARRDSF